MKSVEKWTTREQRDQESGLWEQASGVKREDQVAKTNSEFKQEWEVSFLYFQSPVRPTTIIAMAVIRASI